MKTEKYKVTGMTCAACQANVTRCVKKLGGVEEVDVNLLAGRMTVRYEEGEVLTGLDITGADGSEKMPDENGKYHFIDTFRNTEFAKWR